MAGCGTTKPVPGLVATIGVHDWDLDSFLMALSGLERPFVLDVRQRRGVRGPQYAWANAQRLQRALAAAGIPYRHVRDLAPTTELRQLQYAEDERAGVGKRSREVLADAYRERYVREILDRADLGRLLAALEEDGLGALLCVEADPRACHRSLIADRLAAEHGYEVVHLRPRYDAARG